MTTVESKAKWTSKQIHLGIIPSYFGSSPLPNGNYLIDFDINLVTFKSYNDATSCVSKIEVTAETLAQVEAAYRAWEEFKKKNKGPNHVHYWWFDYYELDSNKFAQPIKHYYEHDKKNWEALKFGMPSDLKPRQLSKTLRYCPKVNKAQSLAIQELKYFPIEFNTEFLKLITHPFYFVFKDTPEILNPR